MDDDYFKSIRFEDNTGKNINIGEFDGMNDLSSEYEYEEFDFGLDGCLVGISS